jgi:hypothetical protein
LKTVRNGQSHDESVIIAKKMLANSELSESLISDTNMPVSIDSGFVKGAHLSPIQFGAEKDSLTLRRQQ